MTIVANPVLPTLSSEVYREVLQILDHNKKIIDRQLNICFEELSLFQPYPFGIGWNLKKEWVIKELNQKLAHAKETASKVQQLASKVSNNHLISIANKHLEYLEIVENISLNQNSLNKSTLLTRFTLRATIGCVALVTTLDKLKLIEPGSFFGWTLGIATLGSAVTWTISDSYSGHTNRELLTLYRSVRAASQFWEQKS